MPMKCSAPLCRGNYSTGEKVSVFKFPANDDLRKKWIAALKREKTFVPSKCSRVCEKHFPPEDIERDLICHDRRTGRTLSTPLPHPRIRVGAVPSIFPDRPSYYTKVVKKRESVEERRLRKDREKLIQAAEATSNNTSVTIAPSKKHVDDKSFSTFNEFCERLNKYPPQSSKLTWTIVKYENDLILLDIMKEPIPKIRNSVIVNKECKAVVVTNDIRLNKMGNFHFPFALENINQLHDILNEIERKTQSIHHMKFEIKWSH
ncbi:THAP domain-containing protein 5-like [Planococcus citri]|uniref:THAP domain-containing protein 5-like n=1 Tax=Planococcus citri TaxID=170843 RepID=UPI0031F7BA21